MAQKNIYHGREIKFYDYFESKKEGLIREFLAEFPDFYSLEPLRDAARVENQVTAAISQTQNRGTAWKLLLARSSWQDIIDDQELKTKFPTLSSIIDFFGEDNIALVSYSILEANGVIKRHTGPENRAGKFIRIHVPLIVPTGDLGMEVNGEIVNWSDTFGFNNQIIHSVWNDTPSRRLILLIDLRRSHCDLPDADPWTEETNANAVPFPKTENRVVETIIDLVPRIIRK